MTRFKSSSVGESISNAIRGLKLVLSSQRNFVIEFLFGILVLFCAIFLKFDITDICIVIVMIAIVLICELINSVIEFTLDAVYKNNYSKLVEMAKDISAGMVLLSAIISVIVGILIFAKNIISFFD